MKFVGHPGQPYIVVGDGVCMGSLSKLSDMHPLESMVIIIIIDIIIILFVLSPLVVFTIAFHIPCYNMPTV